MARRRKKPKGKKINPTLFVFCEGDTEVAYVNLLKSDYRLPSIHIHPKIRGNNITAEYIESYKQGKPTHEKDLNFLIYDMDVPELIERLNQIDGCTLLLSNPCIELWFLLHYKNQKAHIDTARCLQEMEKRNKVYKKGALNKRLMEKLLTKHPEAVKRAKALSEYDNPSSTLYKLIEILEELKERRA
jgi:hypothetical protein